MRRLRSGLQLLLFGCLLVFHARNSVAQTSVVQISTLPTTGSVTIPASTLVKLDSTGHVVQISLGDPEPLGINVYAVAPPATATTVIILGSASCLADGYIYRGDLVAPSFNTAGYCVDVGANFTDVRVGTVALGTATATTAPNSAAPIIFFGSGHGTPAPTCDVRYWGAKGNVPSDDDAAAMIAALNASPPCQNFILPPQPGATPSNPTVYHFNQPVPGSLQMAIRVDCIDPQLVTIANTSGGSGSYTGRLFYEQGPTTGAHLPFFEIKNCTLRDGSNGMTISGGQDCSAPFQNWTRS